MNKINTSICLKAIIILSAITVGAKKRNTYNSDFTIVPNDWQKSNGHETNFWRKEEENTVFGRREEFSSSPPQTVVRAPTSLDITDSSKYNNYNIYEPKKENNFAFSQVAYSKKPTDLQITNGFPNNEKYSFTRREQFSSSHQREPVAAPLDLLIPEHASRNNFDVSNNEATSSNPLQGKNDANHNKGKGSALRREDLSSMHQLDTKISAPVPSTLELPSSHKLSSSNMNVTYLSNQDKVKLSKKKRDYKKLLNLTDEEFACFEESKIFFNGTCLTLLEKGNCEEGEWLVLDSKSVSQHQLKIRARCVRRICKNNEFYWLITKQCYADDNVNGERLCPLGHTIEVNLFGEATCVCKRLHEEYSDGKCYRLYTRGPCADGYIFQIVNNTTECKINPCTHHTLVLYDENKQCYELNTTGPCNKTKNHIFQVSEITGKPTCVDHLAKLEVLFPSDTKFYCTQKNTDGSCKTPVKIKFPSFHERVLAEVNKHKRKK